MIQYFGYGANRSADMMEAITGRRPHGVPAVLRNYELCIQDWQDIPENVRGVIKEFWGPDFRSYSVREGPSFVRGNLWQLTEEEYAHVAEWELHGLWYQPADVIVLASDQEVRAVTEVINDPFIAPAPSGEMYAIFLNSREKMLATAREVRKLRD